MVMLKKEYVKLKTNEGEMGFRGAPKRSTLKTQPRKLKTDDGVRQVALPKSAVFTVGQLFRGPTFRRDLGRLLQFTRSGRFGWIPGQILARIPSAVFNVGQLSRSPTFRRYLGSLLQFTRSG